MGQFLLLPDDEVLFVRHLVDDEALVLLASDDLSDGVRPVPAFASRPLPPPPVALQPSPEPIELIFWAEALGRVRTVAEAPAPTDASDRVARLLADEAAGGDAGHLLDLSRSPLVRWRRCSWHPNGALCPGLLQAQARKSREQPKELLRLRERVERWMKAQGERLNPFEHAPADVQARQPENVRAFATWAFPAAAQWVRAGGCVWPWNA